jgi:hypothetical protein
MCRAARKWQLATSGPARTTSDWAATPLACQTAYDAAALYIYDECARARSLNLPQPPPLSSRHFPSGSPTSLLPAAPFHPLTLVDVERPFYTGLVLYAIHPLSWTRSRLATHGERRELMQASASALPTDRLSQQRGRPTLCPIPSSRLTACFRPTPPRPMARIPGLTRPQRHPRSLKHPDSHVNAFHPLALSFPSSAFFQASPCLTIHAPSVITRD